MRTGAGGVVRVAKDNGERGGRGGGEGVIDPLSKAMSELYGFLNQ